MNNPVIYINISKLFIYIFLFQIKFIKSEGEEESIIISSVSYPTAYTLSNQNIVMVTSDGIHFYNTDLIEDNDKKILFEKEITLQSEFEKTTIAQFSEEDGGYIMIIVNDTLYFFQENGTPIKSLDLSISISSLHYCLIPYKKEADFLYYIISYPIDIKSFNLTYFKFDLNSPNSNEIIKSKNIETKLSSDSTPYEFVGVNCIIMLNPENNKILVCFYAISFPREIQTKSFNINDDFEEYNEYFGYYSNSDGGFLTPKYISGATNENKEKALIYFVNGNAYKMTFDFINLLSEPIKINDDSSYKNQEYTDHKLFYFKHTQEFICASFQYYQLCKVYLASFKSDFTLKNQALVDPDNLCSNSNSFSVFYNKNSYSIVVDNLNDKKIVIKKATELGNTENLDGNEENINTEENNNNSNNINSKDKCKKSTNKSIFYNLCTECNIEGGYFPVEDPNNSLFHGTEGFFECYNENTKPTNFYLNKEISNNYIYKPCYETCSKCEEGGNEYNNNCLECEKKYIIKPKFPESKMCVTKCSFAYYYTHYGQYKCTTNNNCPEEAYLYIPELGKCTNDCSQENEYRYQYGGRCYKACPDNTILNNGICKNIDNNSCSKSEIKIKTEEYFSSEEIDLDVKYYIKEFGNNEKHVSYYYNDKYSLLLYKESFCIEELNINMPKVDFGQCYNKIQDSLNLIDKKVIIALAEKFNEKKSSTTSYFFYNPETGTKLEAESICKEDVITIKENLMSQLNSSESNVNIESILFLTGQNIDIFNLSGEFYTDICYHFESPNGKDIPLKDRIKEFYPNISLCDDSGCTYKGVNLTTMESICECKFNDILNNKYFEGNVLIENTLGEITDILTNSNLDVLKCFQNVFKRKYIIKSIGGFIILIIIFFEIICTLYFFLYSYFQIIKYLYYLSSYYVNLINTKNQNSNNHKKNESAKEISLNKLIKNKRNKNKDINLESTTNKIKLLKSEKLLSKYDNNKLLKNNKLKNEIKESYHKNHLKRKNTKNEDLDNILKNYGININEYLKTEFDNMDFDDAIKYDNRTFFEYFCQKFNENQIIMDTFFNKENLKPIPIKILLLLLNIDLNFVVNGLFISEDYISELYHSNEKENFFSYFPRAISRFVYTTLVSTFIGIIIGCVFIEEKKIKHIFKREKKDPLKLKYEISLISKNIKKNYIIFIIICFLISVFSWYYVNCFNNSYPAVKIEWIKSSITIMIIIQIISALKILLEAILRLISFKFKSEKIFNLKEIIA